MTEPRKYSVRGLTQEQTDAWLERALRNAPPLTDEMWAYISEPLRAPATLARPPGQGRTCDPERQTA
jgi:hypothetical protein